MGDKNPSGGAGGSGGRKKKTPPQAAPEPTPEPVPEPTFRELNTLDELKAFQNESRSEWLNNVSSYNRQGLEWYQEHPGINRQLRAGQIGPWEKQYDLVNKMDAATSGYTLKENTVAYRGVGNPDVMKKFLDGTLVGHVETDKGYQSTTTSKKVAQDFATGKYASGSTDTTYGKGIQAPVIVRLRMQTGTKVGVASGTGKFGNQFELTLGRDRSWTARGATMQTINGKQVLVVDADLNP